MYVKLIYFIFNDLFILIAKLSSETNSSIILIGFLIEEKPRRKAPILEYLRVLVLMGGVHITF
jgi:hypothetical protein